MVRYWNTPVSRAALTGQSFGTVFFSSKALMNRKGWRHAALQCYKNPGAIQASLHTSVDDVFHPDAALKARRRLHYTCMHFLEMMLPVEISREIRRSHIRKYRRKNIPRNNETKRALTSRYVPGIRKRSYAVRQGEHSCAQDILGQVEDGRRHARLVSLFARGLFTVFSVGVARFIQELQDCNTW